MLSSRVCCSRVPCASPWGSPDRGERHVSSWGIRMELFRIVMRAPCHQGEGSLHLAHADGSPCDAPHSASHPGKNSVRSDMSGSSNRIFHIQRLTPDGRGGCFNFPGQTCPDPLIVLTRRASAVDNSDSPDSLTRQTLAIRRIHFRPQSKSKLW